MSNLRTKHIVELVCLAVLPLLLLALGTDVSAAPPTDDGGLFVDAPQPRLRAQAQRPTVQRSRNVTVRLNLLDGAAAPARSRLSVSARKTISLNLFADVKLIAVQDRARLGPNGLTWIGHIDGVKNSAVTLIVRNGILSGNIRTPNASYQVRYGGNQTHVIYQINDKAFPQERKPLKVDQAKLRAATVKAADTGSAIDLLVVYTPAARYMAGGDAAMSALIELAVEETNQAFRDTPVNPASAPSEVLQLNLVHTEVVTITESGDISTDLSNLQNPSDGVMDNVPILRDRYGADVVTLVEENAEYCGAAFDIMDPVSASFAPYAYDVVATDCMAGNYTLAHELGHLMSARHNWEEDPTDNAPFTYNHGYIAPDKLFRDIMAYYSSSCDPFGCPRVGLFSNPDNTNFGEPAGVPEGSFHAADVRKTLANTAFTVANFRPSVQEVPSPGPAALISPTGKICTRQPALNWTAGSAATWYDLWVEGTTGALLKQWYEASKVCTGTNCVITPTLTLELGSYTWSVLSWNSTGSSEWSSLDFVVDGPPNSPTAIAPSGTITLTTPTFKWNALNNVVTYTLRVRNEATQVEAIKELSAADVCAGSTCAGGLATALATGNYTWSVRPSSTCGGQGPWSTGMAFAVSAPLGKPTPISPSGAITATMPTFTWTAVDGATSYGLELTLITAQATRARLSEPRLDIAHYCAGSTCSYTMTTPLSAGSYYWRVQARDSRPPEQWSEWSDRMDFTLTTSACRITSLVEPTGTIANTAPTYRWTFSGECTMFYPWVIKKPSAQVYPITWLSSSQVCSGSSCAWTPTQLLPGAGDYAWSILGYPGYDWPGVRDFSLSTTSGGFVSPMWDGWEYHAGTWYPIGFYPTLWLYTDGVAGLWASASQVGNYSTLDYQATLWRYGCESCSNAITIRGAPTPVTDGDWYSAYQFQYSRAGNFSVWKGVNGSWTPLQYWVATPAINQGNAWNTLRVVASGSALYYYINGTLVWIGSDSALSSGRVGVVMSRTDGTSTGNALFVSNASLTIPVFSTKALPDKVNAAQQAANDAANRAKTGALSAGPKK